MSPKRRKGTPRGMGELGQASCLVFLGLVTFRKAMANEVLLVIMWQLGR